VPSDMKPDNVVAKANCIAESGSAESLLFRQVLTETDGVTRVGQIVSKVPAYTVSDSTLGAPTQPLKEEDDSKWKMILGGVGVFLLVSCLVTGGCVMKRKMETDSIAEPKLQDKPGDVEEGVNTNVAPTILAMHSDVKDANLVKVAAVEDTPKVDDTLRQASAPNRAAEVVQSNAIDGVVVSFSPDKAAPKLKEEKPLPKGIVQL